jgi:hypothetical protein
MVHCNMANDSQGETRPVPEEATWWVEGRPKTSGDP